VSELDRLILALLNATGVTYRAIEATDDPDAGGSRIIAAVADRLRGALATFAEHYSDEEMGELSGVLAQITLLLAEDLGLEDYFRPRARGPGAGGA
jgi:hypothetical protein